MPLNMADPNVPILTTPQNNSLITGNVIVFTFDVPSDTDYDLLVFKIELDTVNPPSSSNPNYKYCESRLANDKKTQGKWEVKNVSNVYVDMPTGGVNSDFYGKSAKVTLRLQDTTCFPSGLSIWYWKISVGDGVVTVPVYNRAVFGQAVYKSV